MYYRLFPNKLKKKQAYLLLEYEELLKRKGELAGVLADDANLLETFAQKIRSIDENAFERRFYGRTAPSIIESFDVSRIGSYQKIKATAIEYENVIIKLFVVRQKLKLYGIDRRLENEKKALGR
ncbi:MAG: hypothetical protein Sv326_0682 [Candidatus Fermentimicrarchaeum limneticum]|uniref:Uncharacterized protein n=1 Tax=Fermentimicrarchaeum limneticum TaxID=2795018 RepID=A0A7D6BA89_FERL1|nr:MAG: hypothetical protein Sv326_0682 [Candidatus Fermentimicrarchaeum limneticum]